MPTFKTTFFFEAMQPSEGTGGSAVVGWTETWYQTTSGNLDAALTNEQVGTYITLRRGILANLYAMTWIRVSDVDNPRSVKIRNLGYRRGNAVGVPAQVTCALLVDIVRLSRTAGEPAHHKRFLLRGLSSTDIDGNIISGNANNLPALARFLNYVGDHQVGVNRGARAPAPYWQIRYFSNTAPFVQITALQVGVDDNTIAVTSGNVTGTLGTKYRIRRVRFPYFINRVWNDLGGLVPGTSTLGRSRRHLAGTWSGTGEIQLLNYLYNVPDQYTIIGLREKKTGRPRSLFRGRKNPVV